jgi:hypothetical protein
VRVCREAGRSVPVSLARAPAWSELLELFISVSIDGERVAAKRAAADGSAQQPSARVCARAADGVQFWVRTPVAPVVPAVLELPRLVSWEGGGNAVRARRRVRTRAVADACLTHGEELSGTAFKRHA